jgi:hypothetical protein
VVLDVFPDVFAYGILCSAEGLEARREAAGGRLPARAGRAAAGRVIGEHRAYHDFAGKLAERGFITFAPQNLYIGKDDFRTLQRKANPLGKTLFSIIVPQHQQIVDWLKTLPFVDGERIGFYGLSYGGKRRCGFRRWCPILPVDLLGRLQRLGRQERLDAGPLQLRLDGRVRNLRVDLGSTFNYAEMAALIAPRPFMVERGHFDGVGVDERWPTSTPRCAHLHRQARDGRPLRDRMVRRPAQDQRRRDVRVPAQAFEVAGAENRVTRPIPRLKPVPGGIPPQKQPAQ